MDFFIITALLVALLTSDYLIKIDINRHNNQLVECKQFAICLENLPKVTDTYSIEQLKADLWDYLVKTLKKRQ